MVMRSLRRWAVGLSTLVCACVGSAVLAQADERPGMLVDFHHEKGAFQSAIMSEERRFEIFLPPSYYRQSDFFDVGQNQHRRYPVVYVLGGHMYKKLFAAIIGHLAVVGQVPEMIIVSVESNLSLTSNRIIDTTPTKANPDSQGAASENPYGGGADKYFEYMGNELIPHIDKHYRTTGDRTIIGHSVGGLAVLYNFIKYPDMFHHYLALDPSAWWDDQMIVAAVDDALSQRKPLEGRLYVALSDKKHSGYHDDTNMLLGNRRVVELLEREQLPTVNLQWKTFPKSNHGTVVFPGMYEGMLFLWGGHTFFGSYESNPYQVLYPRGGIAKVLDHYEAYSKKMAGDFIPDERDINWLAGLANKQAGKKAVSAQQAFYRQLQRDLLRLNVKNYPKSSQAHISLAEYHVEVDQVNKAVKQYKKALKLRPDDKDIEGALKRLVEGSVTERH